MVMRFLSRWSIRKPVDGGRWTVGGIFARAGRPRPRSPVHASCLLRTTKLRRELVEHAVDELVAVGAAVALRQLDGLVDHGAIRHFRLVLELLADEQQDAALDRGETR